MTRRTYGQYCGIARAAELVGERWAMLIVRDLILAPKRYTDLHQGLPGIPTNVLASRLKELEANGVIQRRVLPPPSSAIVYDLTSYGRELEDILLRLGRWGARSLDEPVEGEAGYIDPSIRALRATFRPEAARGLQATYELRFGSFVVCARVRDGELEVCPGPAAEPDLVIDVRSSLTPVMTGEVTPEDATVTGRVNLSGERALFDRFAELFPLPPGRREAAADATKRMNSE